MENPYFNPNTYETQKKRSSMGIVVIVCCVVLTALIGLLIGLLLSNNNKADNSALDASPTDNSYSTYALTTATPGSEESGKLNTVEPSAEPDATADATYNLESSAGSATTMVYDGQYTRAQVAELCAPSVVGIDTTVTTSYSSFYGFGSSGTYESQGSGSGIVLTEDGYILTCAHVIENANAIVVTLNDDTSYDATVVGSDSVLDIAVLKIDATGLTPADIGDSDMLTVGEDVLAIGNPLGELRGTVTSGIISATSRSIEVEGTAMDLIQTDAAVSPGNSGGGLFNASAKLIGIVNAKVSDSDAEGLSFAIPINNVLKEINDLMNYGYITDRAVLGVSTQNVTLRSNYGGYNGYANTTCVQVVEVAENGAAYNAGIEAGDLILKLGDTTISSNDDLVNALAAYKIGESATIVIQRNGQQYTANVTF